jgi:hypothetical protein
MKRVRGYHKYTFLLHVSTAYTTLPYFGIYFGNAVKLKRKEKAPIL